MSIPGNIRSVILKHVGTLFTFRLYHYPLSTQAAFIMMYLIAIITFILLRVDGFQPSSIISYAQQKQHRRRPMTLYGFFDNLVKEAFSNEQLPTGVKGSIEGPESEEGFGLNILQKQQQPEQTDVMVID